MPNVKTRPEKDCPTCGEHFVAKRPDQVFCSKKCVRHGGKNHPICPCGQQTDSYMKKYCCTEHRVLWGGKKAPMEMIEHTCQECGRIFERPRHYPGKKMFCSVSCSSKQHSRKRAQHYRFGQLTLNSSYELRFIACMERLAIVWEPWPDSDPQTYAVDGDEHTYTPDFRLPGLAIEVKGWDHPDSIQPLGRAAWNKPEHLVVVDRELLGKLEHEFNRERAVDLLRKA